MKAPTILPSVDLESLKAFDSCTISNAIERLNVRMRNEGFIAGAARCQFPKFPPTVGYAATARVRSEAPPISQRCYFDRMDWWNYIASLPRPTIMVLQDCDDQPGLGAFVSEVHAAIGLALGCAGCLTNGAVRELPAIEALGFQLYASRASVSHAYAHIFEFGGPVEIDGLKISPGDLLHGDLHGVLSIPLSVAAQVPLEASKIHQERRELIQFCKSPVFSLAGLDDRLKNMNTGCDPSWRGR